MSHVLFIIRWFWRGSSDAATWFRELKMPTKFSMCHWECLLKIGIPGTWWLIKIIINHTYNKHLLHYRKGISEYQSKYLKGATEEVWWSIERKLNFIPEWQISCSIKQSTFYAKHIYILIQTLLPISIYLYNTNAYISYIYIYIYLA